MKTWVLSFLLFVAVCANAQVKPFRFAFISDTHIGSPNGGAEEDLLRTVRDINAQSNIDFVVITGDITELGTNNELKEAKRLLDSLHIPFYILPGNHDTGWSESGGVMFASVFGYDKFSFEHNGIRFLGCASGPYVRMSDGHVPRDAVNWLDAELKKLKPGQPVIFLNHYPLDNGLDNWYEITDRLRNFNTWAALCGHGHTNRAMNFEDIPGVMGRSNLRAKAAVGGYNLVEVRTDSILFYEKKPGIVQVRKWTGVGIEQQRNYDRTKTFPRPDYAVNKTYAAVTPRWVFSSDANIISTPAVSNNRVFAGNQNGSIACFQLQTGKLMWTYQTKGAIFSSPAVTAATVIVGSGDGSIYCINQKTGKLKWKKETGVAILGSALLHGDTVFIGGSGGNFYALHATTGKTIWTSKELNGPVVSKPVLENGTLIFGAWDRHLYALNSSTGTVLWKWNNGSSVINYSPASCIPVIADNVVYVVAPDRYISAIDVFTGNTLWRNNDAAVRESIGISRDGKYVYGKTMQDTIVIYKTSREKQSALAKIHCGFGYEHVPSMLFENDGLLYFGTRNGVVYCVNPSTQKIQWQHKIDNSMVNTIQLVDAHTLVASTMDGKLVVLDFTKTYR
jgi:outer membrane protein assembly factor BamB/predicted phosphodiesterase